MARLKITVKSILILTLVMFIAGNIAQPPEIYGKTQQSTKNQLSAVETLKQYIELRFMDSDWEKYSQFITWPDEPAWDCKWVVSKYDIGHSKKKKGKIIISVVYLRLGLYCNDLDFNPESKKVTVNYELVKSRSGWKVNSPIPDYPEISENVLVRQLRASTDKETPERRVKIEAIINKIKDISAGSIRLIEPQH